MSTIVRQATNVSVNVMERTATYVTNTVIQMLLRVAGARHLDVGYLAENREWIEQGLFVWLAEQTLQQAHLEVYMPGQDTAIERWDFAFTYANSGGSSSTPPPVAKLQELCAKLHALPQGVEYRIVVHIAREATKVPGWEPTELRQMNQASEQELEDWGHGNTAVRLICRSST